ncbi:MAG: cation diffusion facilitator family transporter [Planctomycetota bacterium]
MERTDWIVPTGGREKSTTARAAILVALSLAALKLAAGLLTGSIAVLASAADSLMDAFASGVNYAAIRFADEPEDTSHRFGHGKVEGMAGLFQAAVIGASAAFLIVESVRRLVSGGAVEVPLVGIGVMVVSLVATILLVLRMRRVAKESESLALEADSLHYLSDVLTNGAVLLGLLAVAWLDVAWVDPVASLIISAALVWTVVQVFRESVDNLMDRELPDEERERILRIAEREVPGVLGVHDLRTRRSGARRFVVIHVEIDRRVPFVEAHRRSEQVVRAVEAGLPYTRVTVHADPWPPERGDDPDGAGR